MSEPITTIPTWGTLALFLVSGMLVAVIVWLATLSSEARGRALVWILGAIGLGTLAMILFGVSFVRATAVPARVVQVVPRSVADEPARQVVQETAIQPIHQEEVAADTLSHSDSERFWAFLYGSRIKLVAALLIGFLALVASKSKAFQSAPKPAVSADVKSGSAWLVLPAVCLSVLGYLSAPTLFPRPNPDLSNPASISGTTQQKMDKIVRDLIEKSQQPDSSVKSVPPWIKLKPDSPDIYVLSSQPYATKAEAEAELMPLAANLLQRAFHQHHPWQGSWNVPLAQVRERVVDEEFPQIGTVTSSKGPLETYAVHWLIDVSPSVCETFTTSWKNQIIERRLKVFGVLLVWLSGVLLMSRGYFWSLSQPDQSHRWASTLKASILTIGVTALAGWVLVEFIH